MIQYPLGVPVWSCAIGLLAERLSALVLMEAHACDMWEHAYCLDYRNSRRQYLDAFWKLLNWDFVAGHYQKDPRQLYR